jgi:hypothetical protein
MSQTEMFITGFLGDEDVHAHFDREVAIRIVHAASAHAGSILSMPSIATDICEHPRIEDIANSPPLSPFVGSFQGITLALVLCG